MQFVLRYYDARKKAVQKFTGQLFVTVGIRNASSGSGESTTTTTTSSGSNYGGGDTPYRLRASRTDGQGRNN